MSDQQNLQLWCPQCGPNVGSDGDGCCHDCGCDLIRGEVIAQIQKSARMEFVLVPVNADTGEIEGAKAIATITLADIDDGITLVGHPADLPESDVEHLMTMLKRAREKQGGKRMFLLFRGQIGGEYQVLRAIPKAAYDEDFGERRPVASAGS